MITTVELRLDPKSASSNQLIKNKIAEKLGKPVSPEDEIVIRRRSIDARQRNVIVNLTVDLYTGEPVPQVTAEPVEYKPVGDDAPQAIIVGAGPAGLFAALRLIENGIRPLVLERGKDVERRAQDLAQISRSNTVDPDSNYCFGEGGAGAFSDGKLFTRSKKRGNTGKILNILHQHGAKADILVDVHAHIGSDKLPRIIKAIRQTIERCGGKVMFDSRVDGLLIDGNRVTGVKCYDGKVFHGPVILATGHSARDTYRILAVQGITLEPKGIAVGVRLEHPQKLIDCIRYHSSKGRGEYLPPAEYTMLTRVDGRAVYSFCMCPGGVIVPAASAPGELVVNGMSASQRNGKWANSGLVVEVLPEDIPGDSPLKMMEYQKEIEQRFFEDASQTQNAPAQKMTDFVNSKDSDPSTMESSSYPPGIHPARIDKLLPAGISSRMQRAFLEFDRKNRGFLTDRANLIGAETRTSSPVRIPRDKDTLQHIGIAGLFPAGEGAGYAGGIVSAAIDGDRCADSLTNYIGYGS